MTIAHPVRSLLVVATVVAPACAKPATHRPPAPTEVDAPPPASQLGAGHRDEVVTEPPIVERHGAADAQPGSPPEQGPAETIDADALTPEVVIRDGSVYAHIALDGRSLLEVEAALDLGGCDSMDADLDPLEGRDDLRVLQISCESGEDFFSRSLETYLVALPRMQVLWQGSGEYSNEMGVCESFDAAWFEPLPNDRIRVYQEQQVLHDTSTDLDVDCDPTDKVTRELSVLHVPVGG
ncbi:MAG: hypothetical protein K0V04_42200 [Deltaproteobacteria bacterium]|nr:hypothetical protein [Deltaproteobacteria bacterium]